MPAAIMSANGSRVPLHAGWVAGAVELCLAWYSL